MTNHGLTEEDTRDRDKWRSLVLGEGKPLKSGRTLDESFIIHIEKLYSLFLHQLHAMW
jgi:hypothetical protein